MVYCFYITVIYVPDDDDDDDDDEDDEYKYLIWDLSGTWPGKVPLVIIK